MASVKSVLSLVIVNLIIVSVVLAQDLQLEGELLTRQPENGLVQKDQVMKCLQNGEVPEDLKWYTVKDEEEELITSGKYIFRKGVKLKNLQKYSILESKIINKFKICSK